MQRNRWSIEPPKEQGMRGNRQRKEITTMLTYCSLVQDICLGAAENFPRWSDGQVQPVYFNPAWSRFYVQCGLCHEPVLNDVNWEKGHLAMRHSFSGRVAHNLHK